MRFYEYCSFIFFIGFKFVHMSLFHGCNVHFSVENFKLWRVQMGSGGGEKYESDVFGVVAVNGQCLSWLEIKKGERCFLHVSSRLASLCDLLESLSRDEVAPPASTGGMDAVPPTCAKLSMEVRSHFSNLDKDLQIHLEFIPDCVESWYFNNNS